MGVGGGWFSSTPAEIGLSNELIILTLILIDIYCTKMFKGSVQKMQGS